jgi:hypothetical protein
VLSELARACVSVGKGPLGPLPAVSAFPLNDLYFSRSRSRKALAGWNRISRPCHAASGYNRYCLLLFPTPCDASDERLRHAAMLGKPVVRPGGRSVERCAVARPSFLMKNYSGALEWRKHSAWGIPLRWLMRTVRTQAKRESPALTSGAFPIISTLSRGNVEQG